MNDFLSRFTLAFVQSQGMRPAEACSLAKYSATLDQIGRLIVRSSVPRSPSGVLEPLDLLRGTSHPGSLPSFQKPLLGNNLPKPSLDRATSAAPSPGHTLTRERSTTLATTFQRFNDSGTGFLEVDEFVKHVMALPQFGDVRHDGKPLDEESLRTIAEAIAASHVDSNGSINLLQFARAFAVVDSSGSSELAEDLHEHILTFLYRHRQALRSACAERDADGSGRVSRRDFARVLEAVNFCASKPARHLTRAQMVALVESLADCEGPEDIVSYEAFLASFEIHIA